jgi:hypothetical protein
MGILDDAIKEHLELKRQHGAADDELKQLEDEAFGAAERPGGAQPAPDPVAEAPTEFLTQPEVPPVDEAEVAPEVEAETAPPAAEEAAGRPHPRTEIADLQEAPARPEAEEPMPPAEEESPALEHETIPEPAPQPTGPTTEEREAIAEQPTEMFDVEGEIAAEKPEVDFDDDEDDDFWNEQRLSDELDQALEAPAEDEDEIFEEDEAQADEPLEADGPLAEEGPPPPAQEQPRQRPDEDVLEETPDFLEEAPEDDQLWFEQKPPKDFDFDD